MVVFTPITVNDQRTASITVDDVAGNLDDTQANFVAIQNCLSALNPLGPDGPLRPDGSSSGIPMVFKTVTDEDGNTVDVKVDISSTAAFQRSLNGLTINQGEALITLNSNPNAFGTSVGRGDALMALITNPTQDITNTTDWLRLEGDDSYSVTLSERQLLNTANEEDTISRVVDASTEVTITFYLLSTAATVDGDLTGGQTSSFTQTSDQRNGILYVRLQAGYLNSTSTSNLYVEIVDPGGNPSTFVALSTYTERTDLLVGGDDVYESASTGFGTAINYAAGQTIRLWRTSTTRLWYFGSALDVLRSIAAGAIELTKLSPEVQALIRNHPAVDITSLESRVNALYPLTADVEILTEWADIYRPERPSDVVNIVPEYTLLADFRGTPAADHYESAGVGYVDGTNIIDYSDLGEDNFRSFGFRVSAAANQTLLSLGNGGTVIPFIDITSSGNFRVNDFTPARADTEVISNHPAAATLDSGTGTISVGGTTSVYTIPDYPANTENQSRTMSVEFDVLVDDVNTDAGGGIGLSIPNDETAQAQRTISHTFFLGFPSGRSVSATIGYEFRKSGADFLLDLTLENAPSDVTLLVNNATTFQSYTANAVIPREDNWINFGTGAGDFTFTGSHEFLVEFVPVPNNLTRMEAIGAAVNTSTGATSEFNNITLAVTVPSFDEVQIPDTIEFRTFKTDHYLRHSQIATLLADRDTKWVYALARLETTTDHAISESIDLATGSTVNGDTILVDNKDEVHQATGTGTGVGELVQNVVLPANYTNFSYLHVTEFVSGVPNEWRFMVLDIALLTSGDVGVSDLIRIQGNTDFTWTSGSRTLTSQGGQTIWRAVLLDL